MAREEMAGGLTRGNLHGIWIALTTPFAADNRIDTGIVRENVRRCHAAGLHGAYTTDSDGEFYAVELDDFRTLVEAFGDECRKVGMPSQAGVTWLNTQGTVDRLRIAADSGVMGAHVGHPVFMPMTPASFDQFWEDVSDAVPDDFGLIQYNTPRQPHVLGGDEYRALAERFPKLIGAKYVQAGVDGFMDVRRQAPELSCFAGEHVLTAFAMHGARGNYSWMAGYNPTFMLDWWDEIERGEWDAAARRNERLQAFGAVVKRHLVEDGNLHGIIGKAMSAASPFLVETTWETRRPYLPVSRTGWEDFVRTAAEEFPDLAYQS